MNLHDARSLLGLSDEEVTRDGVRRSYMRKLREHPPERDPDGFRQLRDAYELVIGALGASEPPPPAASAAAIETVSEPDVPAQPSAEPTRDTQPVASTTVSLRSQVASLLDILIGGDIARASDYEEACGGFVAPSPAERGDRALSMRWALTRQLLGVAHMIDNELVVMLARGIATNDFSQVRPEIEAYARKKPSRAADSNDRIYRRARGLYEPIEGALLATPLRRKQWQLMQWARARRLAIVGIVVFIVLMIAGVANSVVQGIRRAGAGSGQSDHPCTTIEFRSWAGPVPNVDPSCVRTRRAKQ